MGEGRRSGRGRVGEVGEGRRGGRGRVGEVGKMGPLYPHISNRYLNKKTASLLEPPTAVWGLLV